MSIRFGNNRRLYMAEKREKINRLNQSLENAEREISGLKDRLSAQSVNAVEREQEFLSLVNQLQRQNLELQDILIQERQEDEIEDAEYQAIIERLKNENSNLTVQEQKVSSTIADIHSSFKIERTSLKKEIQHLLQSLMNRKNEIQELNSSIVDLRQQKQHTYSHLTSAMETFKQILIVHTDIMHLCEKSPSFKERYPFYNITTIISDRWLMQAHETTEEWDERLTKVLTTIKGYKVNLEDTTKVSGKTRREPSQSADRDDFSSIIEEHLLANKNKRFIIKSIAKSAHITIGLAAQHVENIRSTLILEVRSDMIAYVQRERADNKSDSAISKALLEKYPANLDEVATVLQTVQI